MTASHRAGKTDAQHQRTGAVEEETVGLRRWKPADVRHDSMDWAGSCLSKVQSELRSASAVRRLEGNSRLPYCIRWNSPPVSVYATSWSDREGKQRITSQLAELRGPRVPQLTKNAVKREERKVTIRLWQARWSATSKAAWTRTVIPDVERWLGRTVPKVPLSDPGANGARLFPEIPVQNGQSRFAGLCILWPRVGWR